MLSLADAFAHQVIATLWIFSMGAVDVGALLLSAWPDLILQRRHCRVKDWPYSQAVITVCDFVGRLILQRVFVCDVVSGGMRGGGRMRALSCRLHAAAC
jgi:hypothetical protein